MPTMLPDTHALDAFAREFAAGLRPGDTVALHGPLGAGKTTFVRAVVRALHGSDDRVSSPTFVFRQTYDDGQPTIEHLDLYRVEDPRERDELGLEDAFAADRVTFVEWPDRAGDLLPPGTISVTIDGAGDGPRSIVVVR